MPRKRHVSRNYKGAVITQQTYVMPRKRHVSRNGSGSYKAYTDAVMPRKRHVSRNIVVSATSGAVLCHASQEACE